MTISGRISPLSKENNPPEIEKAAPLKPQERLKYQLFKQYKSHLPIKFFLSIDGR
jgi:hypothetical protein